MTGAGRRSAVAAAGMLLAAPLVSAAPAGEWRSWCHEPGTPLGWHFYCDRETPDEASPSDPLPAAPAPQSATERVRGMRRQLEEVRAAAVLEPTAENVRAYLVLQRETLARASAFSDAFRRTVWRSPDLDYTLTRPVGALAKRLWSDERREARAAALAGLNERYGLIYLGQADCAACEVFGPLLRAFAIRHDLDVLAVSMTGEPLEGWPESVPDNGRAAGLGLAGAPVPAVVLFDTETQRPVPVGFGVLAEDELSRRIFALTAVEPGRDY